MSKRVSKSKRMKPRYYCADDKRWNKAKRIAKILEKYDSEMSASKVLREVTDLMKDPNEVQNPQTVSDFL